MFNSTKKLAKLIRALSDPQNNNVNKTLEQLSHIGDCQIKTPDKPSDWLRQWPEDSIRHISNSLKKIKTQWSKIRRKLQAQIKKSLKNPEHKISSGGKDLHQQNAVFEYLIETLLQESDHNLVSKIVRMEVANYGQKTQTVIVIEHEEDPHRVCIVDWDDKPPEGDYKIIGSDHGKDVYGYYGTEEIAIPAPFSFGMSREDVEGFTH